MSVSENGCVSERVGAWVCASDRDQAVSVLLQEELQFPSLARTLLGLGLGFWVWG